MYMCMCSVSMGQAWVAGVAAWLAGQRRGLACLGNDCLAASLPLLPTHASLHQWTHRPQALYQHVIRWGAWSLGSGGMGGQERGLKDGGCWDRDCLAASIALIQC